MSGTRSGAAARLCAGWSPAAAAAAASGIGSCGGEPPHPARHRRSAAAPVSRSTVLQSAATHTTVVEPSCQAAARGAGRGPQVGIGRAQRRRWAVPPGGLPAPAPCSACPACWPAPPSLPALPACAQSRAYSTMAASVRSPSSERSMRSEESMTSVNGRPAGGRARGGRAQTCEERPARSAGQQQGLLHPSAGLWPAAARPALPCAAPALSQRRPAWSTCAGSEFERRGVQRLRRLAQRRQRVLSASARRGVEGGCATSAAVRCRCWRGVQLLCRRRALDASPAAACPPLWRHALADVVCRRTARVRAETLQRHGLYKPVIVS